MERVLWQRGLLLTSVVSGKHGQRTAEGLSPGQELLLEELEAGLRLRGAISHQETLTGGGREGQGEVR